MKRVVPWIVLALVLAFAAVRRRARGAGQARAGSGGRLQALTTRAPAFLRGDVALIAAREVRQRARGRTFRAVTVLMLAGVAAAIVIPVATHRGATTSRVGVTGELSPTARAALVAAGASAGTPVRIVAEPSTAAARAALTGGRIDLAVVADREVLTNRPVTSADTSATARLARTVAGALGVQRAMADAGLSTGQVAAVAGARALPLSSVQAPRGRPTERAVSILGVILLFVLLSQYNTWTLIGVMEEKSSRVVEVLLATVRPLQLLAGKVLGIGLLVFAQAGLVVAFALTLGAAVGSDLLQGAGPLMVVTTFAWLVLGYAFYSWVYAAVGSMAERQDQVQSLALPIAIPMIVAYVLAISAASSGTASTFFVVLAYLPPTAPFAMPVLVGLGDVAAWQVGLAMLASVAGTVLVARLAAQVYQRAVLRTGRRVPLREVLAPGRVGRVGRASRVG